MNARDSLMALAHRVDDRPGLLRDVVRAGYGAAKTALDSVRHRGPVVTRWSPKDQRWHYRWPEGRAVDTGRWRDAQGWATRGFYYGMADLLWRRYRPRPGDVVLDIGAGNGGETLYLASLVGPTGRVLAIEAAPGPYRSLNELVSLNGWPHVEAIQAAVTASSGTVMIEDDEQWVAGSIYQGSGVPVVAVTIDGLCAERGIDRIDWIKMNIEGAEREALQGMERMAPRVMNLTISCHDFLGTEWGRTKDFVLAWLEEHGFTAELRGEGDFVQQLYVYAWR